MSEKRFRFSGSTHILDTETDKEFYAPCENDLLDLLNDLSGENEQLKKHNKRLHQDLHKINTIARGY